MSTALAKQQWIEDNLKSGELYAGLILGQAGVPDYHLVLLPGELAKGNWAKAKEFAAGANGELPTRREQALLYANLPFEFQKDWYWSGTQHAAVADYAWGQNFDYGYQYSDFKSASLRARAVRRLEI